MVEICFHRLQCAGHMYRTLTAYCIYLKPKGIPFVWPGSAVPFGPWQPHIQLLQPQATIQQPLSSALPLQSAPSRPETSRVEKMSSAHAPLLALPAPEPMDLEAKPVVTTSAQESHTELKSAVDAVADPRRGANKDDGDQNPGAAHETHATTSGVVVKPLTVEQSNERLAEALMERKKGSKDPDVTVQALKRPAAKGQGQKPIMKRPAASLKKPAAAVKPCSQTQETKSKIPKGHGKPIPSVAKRIKAMPSGCSRCRGVPGCTPSCWVYAGWSRV